MSNSSIMEHLLSGEPQDIYASRSQNLGIADISPRNRFNCKEYPEIPSFRIIIIKVTSLLQTPPGVGIITQQCFPCSTLDLNAISAYRSTNSSRSIMKFPHLEWSECSSWKVEKIILSADLIAVEWIGAALAPVYATADWVENKLLPALNPRLNAGSSDQSFGTQPRRFLSPRNISTVHSPYCVPYTSCVDHDQFSNSGVPWTSQWFPKAYCSPHASWYEKLSLYSQHYSGFSIATPRL